MQELERERPAGLVLIVVHAVSENDPCSRTRGLDPWRAIDDDGLASPQRTPGEIVKHMPRPASNAFLATVPDTTTSASLKGGAARARRRAGDERHLGSLELTIRRSQKAMMTRFSRVVRGRGM